MDGGNNMMAIDSHPPSTPSKHTSPPSPAAVHPPPANPTFASHAKSPTTHPPTHYPRHPTPSAISVSSDSVIAVDNSINPDHNPENEDPAGDDENENNDEEGESASEDDDEDDEDSESSSGEADEEGDGGDAAEVEHLTVPIQDRVVSSSSSAAAGGPDTDTDAEQAHRQTAQGESTGHPNGNDPTGASGAVTDTASVGPNDPTKKPKSKIRRRLSPSPPPVAKPVPRLTVRLNIPLGGPSNYEVNILHLSKASGQAPPSPPPPPRLGSDSESSSEEERPPPPEINVPVPVAKRRRRRAREYDLNDPFIDDSDLRVDAPTHFAQTKQQGFYVSSGDVALVKDKSPQKPLRNGPGRPPKSSANGGLSDTNTPAPSGGRRRQGPSLTSLLMNATAFAEAPSKVAPLTTVPGQAPAQSDVANSSVKPQSGVGTRDSPIALLDDDDPEQREAKRIKLDEDAAKISTTGGFVAYGNGETTTEAVSLPALSMVSIGPSDSMINAAASSVAGDANGANSKKRKISKEDLERIFHPVVNEALRDLKKSIDEASWLQRGKFPPHLKPLLQQAATVALRHGDYNDNFFDYLPTIFPYNRFTMMKLTSRLMYSEHQKFLQQRQDALLEELRQIAIEDFPKAQEEYARAQASWEERQKRKAENKEEGMDVDTPSRAHSPNPAESDAPGGKEKGEKIPGTREREDRPPQQRFRFTDAIKSRVWGLVHLSNESARLTSVMHGWDNTVPVATEQSLRKSLYSKITAVFPEGWMNSQTISREVSNMKLRLKKEVELAGGKAED
ncbi:hypothetical protein FS837_007131 [Tulasnella sp. UAMH 9824]|nr:hypothetical protein FS837_007131 [Tulasnella sp. UAMH 9824]